MKTLHDNINYSERFNFELDIPETLEYHVVL
jgi:hypothetical protein